QWPAIVRLRIARRTESGFHIAHLLAPAIRVTPLAPESGASVRSPVRSPTGVHVGFVPQRGSGAQPVALPDDLPAQSPRALPLAFSAASRSMFLEWVPRCLPPLPNRFFSLCGSRTVWKFSALL